MSKNKVFEYLVSKIFEDKIYSKETIDKLLGKFISDKYIDSSPSRLRKKFCSGINVVQRDGKHKKLFPKIECITSIIVVNLQTYENALRISKNLS